MPPILSRTRSMQELSGQTAQPSKKSEIKAHVGRPGYDWAFFPHSSAG